MKIIKYRSSKAKLESRLRGYVKTVRAGRTSPALRSPSIPSGGERSQLRLAAFELSPLSARSQWNHGLPFARAGYGLKAVLWLLKQALKADPERLQFL
jgi:hypothetical protein